MRSFLCKLKGDQRGATLVEFALILTPMMGLVLGGIELGYQHMVRSQLEGALSHVARVASTENPDFVSRGNSFTDRVSSELKNQVDLVASGADYTIRQRNYYQFSGIGRSEKLISDKNSNGQYDAGDCWEDLNDNGRFDIEAGRAGRGGADDVVYYEVTLNMPRLLPLDKLLKLSPHFTVTAKAAIRNQPYAMQAKPVTVCG